jgi:hypothetical protein
MASHVRFLIALSLGVGLAVSCAQGTPSLTPSTGGFDAGNGGKGSSSGDVTGSGGGPSGTSSSSSSSVASSSSSSGTGGGGASPTGASSSSSGGSTPCPHDPCTTGAPLDPSCSPCVMEICSKLNHRSCCDSNGMWSAACVTEVAVTCGSYACLSPNCAHEECKTGGPLDPSCDPCVAFVCSIDPRCCSTGWDAFCKQDVDSAPVQYCPYYCG